MGKRGRGDRGGEKEEILFYKQQCLHPAVSARLIPPCTGPNMLSLDDGAV